MSLASVWSVIKQVNCVCSIFTWDLSILISSCSRGSTVKHHMITTQRKKKPTKKCNRNRLNYTQVFVSRWMQPEDAGNLAVQLRTDKIKCFSIWTFTHDWHTLDFRLACDKWIVGQKKHLRLLVTRFYQRLIKSVLESIQIVLMVYNFHFRFAVYSLF